MKLLFECLGLSSKLHSFELRNFRWHTETSSSRSRDEISILDTFKWFLESQICLTKFLVQKTWFSEQVGMEILKCIIGKNISLTELGLIQFFESDIDISNDAEFHEYFKLLPNLEILKLSYQCVSTKVLDILCFPETSFIKYLYVRCHYTESLSKTIPYLSWLKFRQTHRNALVTFEITEIVRREDVARLLPEAIQVNNVKYSCGYTLRTDGNLQTDGSTTVQYLSTAFSESLQIIHLDFGFFSILHLDDAIINLCQTCKDLIRINVIGVFPVRLAERLCETVLQENSALQVISLIFHFASFEDQYQIRQVQDYRQQLKDRGVQFDFNLLAYYTYI
ncbi:F-box only protein 39-like isoform X1 [Stegodyphus dumicola]|uniref:F-box only protein 39-like isoform X1 n=1 Tax=Stegodyphus dumicola TaxID=202533 RepID=UPI0015B020F2|nr:F-box only protein 39-like isoform X1 [Stegodyphus dumicola]